MSANFNLKQTQLEVLLVDPEGEAKQVTGLCPKWVLLMPHAVVCAKGPAAWALRASGDTVFSTEKSLPIFSSKETLNFRFIVYWGKKALQICNKISLRIKTK